MPRASFNIEWDAHEYEHKERSADWFWSIGILTFAVALAAIIFGNVIFGILIIISAFSLSLFINRPPEDVHVVVDERGITRGRIHYPYSTLRSFWIDEDHPHKKIILRSEKLLMPYIIIPFGEDVDTNRLARTLVRFIHEEYHSLPFVEKILEYLGF
jgi:hypothetical protein